MNLLSTAMDTDKTPMATGQNRLVIELKGMGHIPSFKNSKRVVIKDGVGTPRTSKEVKQWMDRAARAIASQLCCTTPTGDGGTQTEPCPRSLIALLPADDCWSVIPEQSVKAHLVEPGHEGATIVIERI